MKSRPNFFNSITVSSAWALLCTWWLKNKTSSCLSKEASLFQPSPLAPLFEARKISLHQERSEEQNTESYFFACTVYIFQSFIGRGAQVFENLSRVVAFRITPTFFLVIANKTVFLLWFPFPLSPIFLRFSQRAWADLSRPLLISRKNNKNCEWEPKTKEEKSRVFRNR